MSRALRLAASVQRAFPCPDPLVMTLAAKVFGKQTFVEATQTLKTQTLKEKANNKHLWLFV